MRRALNPPSRGERERHPARRDRVQGVLREGEAAGVSTCLIDHTAYVFLLDREGKFVTLFPPGTPQERMAMMVRQHLEGKDEG